MRKKERHYYRVRYVDKYRLYDRYFISNSEAYLFYNSLLDTTKSICSVVVHDYFKVNVDYIPLF